MAKSFSVEHQGHNIQVINSLTECKLVIDGVVADVFWGVLAFEVRLTGQIADGDKVLPVKVVMGAKFLWFDCAIFVDHKLIYSSCQVSAD